MVGPPASREAPQDPSHSQTQETDSLVVIRAAQCRKQDPASSGAAGCHQKPPEATRSRRSQPWKVGPSSISSGWWRFVSTDLGLGY